MPTKTTKKKKHPKMDPKLVSLQPGELSYEAKKSKVKPKDIRKIKKEKGIRSRKKIREEIKKGK